MARVRRSIADDLPADAVMEAPKKSGASVLEGIIEKNKAFRPAREVLTRVISVPTIFPDNDLVARVGGWPTQRVAVIHGPSNHGKTILTHGLGLSFLQRNHIYAYVDAEFTTPITWLESMFGDHADNPNFLASRPKSYEEVVDGVRGLCNGIAAAKKAGAMPAETSALIVIDSLRKMMPENIVEKIKRHGASGEKGSIDGMHGASGLIRAALNAAWLDELVPLMYHTGCTIALIVRESDDINATAEERKAGRDWKMTGGKALVFESSVLCRVERAGIITVDPEDWKSQMLGEKHAVTIEKIKIAGRTERTMRWHFHTSNGFARPEGFDRPRDVIEVAKKVGAITVAGSWFTFGKRRWQGGGRMLEALYQSPELVAEVERAARERFELVGQQANIAEGLDT